MRAPAFVPLSSARLATAPKNGARTPGDLAPFVAIVIGAFLIRLLYLSQARAVPMFDTLLMDGESYGAWSDRIASGDWLGSDVFYQAPLYPYFLGVVKLAFGRDLAAIRLVQIALGSLSCGVLYLAGRSFFSRSAGIAAGVLLALSPSAIFFDACVQKANLGLVFTVLLLWALAKLHERPSMSRWLGVGAALGALMLTREETLLLVPVLVAWSWFGFRTHAPALRARWIAAFVGGLALLLAPVALRNAKVGGEFVLTTSQAGSNFYIGNHAGATGSYEPLRAGRSNTVFERRDAIDLAELAVGRKLSSKEVSDYWMSRSFEWIRAHPLDWIGLLFHKSLLLVNAYEMPDAEDLYFYERYVPLLHLLGWLAPFALVAPLAIAGIVLVRKRWRELIALHLVLATLCAGVVAFYVFARYRYPIVPILMLFAGAALVELWRRVFVQRDLRVGPELVALVAGAVLVNWPLYSKDYQLPQSLNNAAIALSKKGEDARAIDLYRESLAIQPHKPEVLGNLGLSLERLRKMDEAVAAYREALAARPEDVYAELRLGSALVHTAHAQEGSTHLTSAEALAKNDAIAWRDLGKCWAEAGNMPRAVVALRTSVKLDPASSETAARLAWLLATLPADELRNGKEALELATNATNGPSGGSAFSYEALAAALAELGRFDEALIAAQKSLALTRAQTPPVSTRDLEARIELYRAHKPFRLGR